MRPRLVRPRGTACCASAIARGVLPLLDENKGRYKCGSGGGGGLRHDPQPMRQREGSTRQQTCVSVFIARSTSSRSTCGVLVHARYICQSHTRAAGRCAEHDETSSHTTQSQSRAAYAREREERYTRTHRFRQSLPLRLASRCHCDWRHRRRCRRRRHLLQEVEARVRELRDSMRPQTHCELQLRM